MVLDHVARLDLAGQAERLLGRRLVGLVTVRGDRLADRRAVVDAVLHLGEGDGHVVRDGELQRHAVEREDLLAGVGAADQPGGRGQRPLGRRRGERPQDAGAQRRRLPLVQAHELLHLRRLVGRDGDGVIGQRRLDAALGDETDPISTGGRVGQYEGRGLPVVAGRPLDRNGLLQQFRRRRHVLGRLDFHLVRLGPGGNPVEEVLLGRARQLADDPDRAVLQRRHVRQVAGDFRVPAVLGVVRRLGRDLDGRQVHRLHRRDGVGRAGVRPGLDAVGEIGGGRDGRGINVVVGRHPRHRGARHLAVGPGLDEGAGVRQGDVAALRDAGGQRERPAADGEVLGGRAVDHIGGRRVPRLEEAGRQVGVLPREGDDRAKHHGHDAGGDEGGRQRGTAGHGREEIEAAGPRFGVAHQPLDQLRRPVELVVGVGQLDGGGEALGQLGIPLLDEGGDGGGVDAARQRQHQAEEAHDQADAAPRRQDADAHPVGDVEREHLGAEDVRQQGGAEAEREDERQGGPGRCTEAQQADARGDPGNPVAEVRRQGSDGGHDSSSPPMCALDAGGAGPW